MIVVTGARGFIGSNLVEMLNNNGLTDLILVDENQNLSKDKNLANSQFEKFIERKVFISWLEQNIDLVDFIFHLGARTDTSEMDKSIFDALNVNYSKSLFSICADHQIPFLYASSAATYGNGELGYNDENPIDNLQALNPYGESKLSFDQWVTQQEKTPPFWAGLKFFNVYGKHEDHKHRMASVIYHAFHTIKKTSEMKLFQSHKDEFKDGEQKRDFISVNDVVSICYFFYKNQKQSGFYNVGTGKARTFNDLVSAVFKAMNKEEKVSYIPTPIDIREAYQYYTQATTDKLRKVGYLEAFTSLEDGVMDYVKNYLDK